MLGRKKPLRTWRARRCLEAVLTYANGEVRTVVNMLVVLDLSGTYNHVYSIGIQTQSS